MKVSSDEYLQLSVIAGVEELGTLEGMSIENAIREGHKSGSYLDFDGVDGERRAGEKGCTSSQMGKSHGNMLYKIKQLANTNESTGI